jgi:branched-chain amino acid transport system substrate-binding protein
VFKLNRAMAIAVLAVLPLPAAACQAAIGGGDKSDVVIAADLELSGTYADVGSTYERALQLEVDQINAAGGVLGGRPLRLEIKDNRSDPGVSVSNVNDFSGQQNVSALIMGVSADCIRAVVKALDDKGIPTVSLASASDVASPAAEKKFIFKIGPNAEDSASLLTSQFKGDNVASVALLSTDDTTGHEALAALQAATRKADATVAASEPFKPSAADEASLTGPVAAALTAHPDALVVSALPQQAVLVAQAAKGAGYKGVIYFDQTAAGNLFVTGSAAAATNNVTMVATESMAIDDIIATSPAKVARKQWFNDYTAKYGNFSAYSTFAADAVQVIQKAVEAARSADRGAIRDFIQNTQFEGLAGQIRITPDNHSGLMPQALTVLVARNGRWHLA